MNWTTEYPKKPGFYWIRNYQILGPSETVSRSERTMAYVTPVNQGLNFWLFQYPDIFRPFDVLSAEWQGPIEPEKGRRNRSEFIRATPGMVCGDCGESDKESFISWDSGRVDDRPIYGPICRECWIKRLTPEQRKVYMV